jgi:hypothetical protein
MVPRLFSFLSFRRMHAGFIALVDFGSMVPPLFFSLSSRPEQRGFFLHAAFACRAAKRRDRDLIYNSCLPSMEYAHARSRAEHQVLYAAH